MSKLLINDGDKLLVGSNGKAYAVRNLDVLKGSTSPVDFTAAAGRILRLVRYGKCEQGGTPTPDAPVDIVCNNGAIKVSPNMANVNEQTARVGYYISAQGVVTADIYNWMYQAFVPCKPNTTYTLSMSQSVYFVSISEYSTAADSGFVVRKTGITGSNTSLTITTGANTNFLRFGTNIDRAAITLEEVLGINWMLVPGGAVVPYIPYVEGGIYIDGTPEALTIGAQTASVENLLQVGDYKDEQDIISGLLTHKVGIKVLDGTESWTKGTLLSSNYYYGGNTSLDSNAKNELICNQFAVGARNVPAIGKICIRVTRNGFLIAPNDQTLDTAEKFKQFLAAQYAAGTPVIVIYPLATPTTESIAPQPLNTGAGTNTLTDTAEVSNPEYNLIYKI